MVTIHFEKDNTTRNIQSSAKTLGLLLKELNLNPETVIVTRNNEVLTEDEKISKDDTLDILSVISGG